MTNFFNKVAVFTDCHFGRSGGSRQANLDNIDFIDWFIDEAKAFGAEDFIFTGDWSDNRQNIQVGTLNYSLQAMEKLSKAFNRVFLIPGNHDEFYRESRELNSIEFGRNIENITIVNEPIIQDDVALIPWLVGEEWKQISNIKTRYMFGHFELGGFILNGMTEMPEHPNHLTRSDFVHQEYVFSGHFHKRQIKDNIVYTGNVFPFTFNDANDDERGGMFLEWGKEPIFKSWIDAPTFRTMKLTELLNNPNKYLQCKKSSHRVSIDIDISWEDSQFLKEVFLRQFTDIRKIDFIPLSKNEVGDQEFNEGITFQSVDQIVVEGLNSLNSNGISNQLLIDIFKGLGV